MSTIAGDVAEQARTSAKKLSRPLVSDAADALLDKQINCVLVYREWLCSQTRTLINMQPEGNSSGPIGSWTACIKQAYNLPVCGMTHHSARTAATY